MVKLTDDGRTVADASALLIRSVERRLSAGKPVRRNLPDGGRVHVDRPLPFLCLYTRPDGTEDVGTRRLVVGEASYLIGAGSVRARKMSMSLLRSIVSTLRDQFGAFLVVEVWAGPNLEDGAPPAFRLVDSSSVGDQLVLDVLGKALSDIRVHGRRATVEVVRKTSELQPRPRPTMAERGAKMLGCTWIGIEVAPFYRNPQGDVVYPAVLRALRGRFGRALQQAFFHFATNNTAHRAKNVVSLGRRAMVRAVWTADEQLAGISSSFDLLIAINPTKPQALWDAFRRSNYDKAPEFRYRRLPIDPSLVKRALYLTDLERIEDPVIASLFREKQFELDRQLTMLSDRGTPRFLLGSQQLYGPCSPELVRHAEEILERIPSTARGSPAGASVGAKEFCRRAESELEAYRAVSDEFTATVQVSDKVMAGLMVSHGHLLVAPDYRSPKARIDALIQHEIGTHLVTYYNGKAQRFRQLSTGLAGYDELQEGLAVLAEFLVGGMSPARLRILAARVLSVRAAIDGGGFIDVFRLLCRFGFSRRTSFNVCIRVFRGGGLTKDMVYLRGLLSVLEHLRQGGDLTSLYLGKIAIQHIEIVQQLRSRSILTAPPFVPHFLERPDSLRRLQQVRDGLHLYDLADQ